MNSLRDPQKTISRHLSPNVSMVLKSLAMYVDVGVEDRDYHTLYGVVIQQVMHRTIRYCEMSWDVFEDLAKAYDDAQVAVPFVVAREESSYAVLAYKARDLLVSESKVQHVFVLMGHNPSHFQPDRIHEPVALTHEEWMAAAHTYRLLSSDFTGKYQTPKKGS